MRMKFKPLEEQTMVITGATSGIGLVTARSAARRGARLMLVARNEPALGELTEELKSQGTDAAYAVADVGDEQQLRHAADEAVRHFGGFDTWINNAAVSIYGRLDEVEIQDMKRLFDTNFWGYVYGSLAAVRHFRERGTGKLINIGSVLGDRSIPRIRTMPRTTWITRRRTHRPCTSPRSLPARCCMPRSTTCATWWWAAAAS